VTIGPILHRCCGSRSPIPLSLRSRAKRDSGRRARSSARRGKRCSSAVKLRPLRNPPVDSRTPATGARPNRSTPREDFPARRGPGIPPPGRVSCDASLSDLGRTGRFHRWISRWEDPQMLMRTHLEACQWVREPLFPNPSGHQRRKPATRACPGSGCSNSRRSLRNSTDGAYETAAVPGARPATGHAAYVQWSTHD
jgi:hypothetical protein